MLALLWLCWVVHHQKSQPLNRLTRVRLYRITEFIGRWSMVDVFVVAIMVALIRTGSLMSIAPGPAALAFTAVVILTMWAAILFDPRSIWQENTGPTLTPTNELPSSSPKETHHV